MATRHPMIAVTLVALGAWVSLGLFGKFVPASGMVAPAVFLLLLFLALAASLTPIAGVVGARLVRSKWYYQHRFRHALRQGTLVALAIVANLALRALSAWFWVDAFLILLAVVLVELIALARK
jgi:hypothetical protein